MTQSQIIASIDESQKLLSKLGILESFSFPSLLKPNKEKYKITMIENPKYEEIFLFSLENNYYNILLKDHSYFQFDFGEVEDRNSGHMNPFARYAFYPNPFEYIDEDLGSIQALYEEGELGFEDYSQAMSEAKPLNKNVPIRYDLSFKQYRKIYHSTAHFHFGMAENSRIPTDKLFTPLLFTIFIANMYYIEDWENTNDENFILDTQYKSKVDNCKKISEYNSANKSYICTLEEGLVAIK